MNCKPGDLAIFVRSTAGNEGRIVQCIRLLTGAEIRQRMLNPCQAPFWLTDRDTNCTWGAPDNSAPDSCLRPIRDQDGEGETLTWAPITKETA